MNQSTDKFSAGDVQHMREAIALAARGLYSTDPNPRVGCVIVRDGRICGRGWHERAGEPHAEINALDEAGDAARGATVYVSLEPCAHHGRTGPCAQALIDARVGRVVAAHPDPNPAVAGGGLAMLRAAGIAVDDGLLAAESGALNPGYLRRMSGGRPWLRLKSAASLDGRTALANGTSRWITSAEAREDVHRYRARSSAILTGIGTVLADDPRMTVRLEGVTARAPLGVLLDSELRCPPSAQLLAHPGGALIFTTTSNSVGRRADGLRAAGAEVLGVGESASGLDIDTIIAVLAGREMNEIMLEAGPALTGSFLRAGRVDEWIIYLAPHLLGPQARPLAELPQLDNMGDRPGFAWQDVQRVGDDLRLVLWPDPRPSGSR